MAEATAERKLYTPIDGCKAQKKDGSVYDRVELEIRQVGEMPEIREVNAAKGPVSVLTMRCPLNNVSRTICWLTGVEPEKDGDTVWASVTFWDRDAISVHRALQAGVRFFHVNGAVCFREYKDRSGQDRRNLEIRVYSFYGYNRAPVKRRDPAFEEVSDPDGDLPF